MFFSCVTLLSNDMFTSVKLILPYFINNDTEYHWFLLFTLNIIKFTFNKTESFVSFFLLSLFTRESTFQKHNYSHIAHR